MPFPYYINRLYTQTIKYAQLDANNEYSKRLFRPEHAKVL